MSWDILILNTRKPVDFENDSWPNFTSRQSVISDIKTIFPDSNWEDPSWGTLENNKASIEFNLGDKENVDNTFMLHVRGGQNPTLEIANMCRQNGWIAFDISQDQFIDNDHSTSDSFNKWDNYRNQIVNASSKKNPWWKFWQEMKTCR